MLKIELVLLVQYVLCLAEISSASKEFPQLAHVKSQTAPALQEETVYELIKRLLPDRANEFVILVDPGLYDEHRRDRFQLRTIDTGRLSIEASSGVAAAWGLYFYLTQYCGCQVTWGGSQLDLPEQLPRIDQPVDIASNDRFHYYQNVCTASYSTVWWNWTRWEREIDWMALRGINLPLAFNGQEAIWQMVYQSYSLTQSEIDEFLGGAGFLSWTRMGNIQGWGGPMSQTWHQQQVALQHRILKRMRNLGMNPVLPGFAGFVPKALKRAFPHANMTRLKPHFGGFLGKYCCPYMLDPDDPLYGKIGKDFIDKLTSVFGTNHVYNADSFNENTPHSNNTGYLASISRSTYSAMTSADPKAIWLLQGWMFAEDPEFWKESQVKAYVTAIPQGKMIILDLQAEIAPQYRQFHSFYGQPFIWCMLHNFGGGLGLYGTMDRINREPFIARQSPNSSMIGIGLTPEGIEQNEVIYEFMMENSWRSRPVNTTLWIEKYAKRRYGKFNENTMYAWHMLLRSVYSYNGREKIHSKYILVRRPSLKMTSYIWYNTSDVFKAWNYMLTAGKDTSLQDQKLFRYDLVDVTRQALQILCNQYYQELMVAYHAKDVPTLQRVGDEIVGLHDDVDILLAADDHFLVGRWIESARALGANSKEKEHYEYNARTQITTWGPYNKNLMDYACKQWAGLMSNYYLPRWTKFVDDLSYSVAKKKHFNQSQYNVEVYNDVERPWTVDFKTVFPVSSQGDSLEISRKLWHKYKTQLLRPIKRSSNPESANDVSRRRQAF